MIGRATRDARFDIACIAATLMVAMSACATSSGAAARSSTDTIVKVNGEAVPLSAYQTELDAALSKKGTDGASARRVVIRRVIRRTCLQQQARARGIATEGLSFDQLSEKIAVSSGAEELNGLEGEARVAKMKEVLGRIYGASDVEYVVPMEQLPTEPSAPK